jgi:DMSO reductase anchor subunit
MIEEYSAENKGQNLWQLPGIEHPFPLPNYSRTEPHLVIKPHAGMKSPLEKVVSNQEELFPLGALKNNHRPAAIRELPLVGFTLLTQAAVGMAICSLALFPVPLPVLLAIGILMVIGGLIAFMHLGRKRNAWRSVIHLKKSWLSREILMAGLFGAAWVVSVGSQLIWKTSPNPWPMAIFGLGLIYSTAKVYHLRAVPAWNSWRTFAAFLLSAAILGTLGINIAVPYFGWLIAAGFGIMAEMGMMMIEKFAGVDTINWQRVAFLAIGIIGILLAVVLPQANQAWLSVPVFLVALAAEAIGRWQFYAKRIPFPLRAN